jgi:DNA-binding response OmpR family regulator
LRRGRRHRNEVDAFSRADIATASGRLVTGGLHEISTQPARHLNSWFRTVVDVARILVVEDDQTIATAVADRLLSEGFEVSVASDGQAGLDADDRDQPDLVLLDLMLPRVDGIEVCRRLHARRDVPVIMLTARSHETDMLIGLAVGADDYLTKPFSMRELVARVRTVLRRAERATVPTTGRLIDHGRLRIDESRRQVAVDTNDIALTPTEFDLLMCLANRQGAVLTRESLLNDVWGYRDGSGARTVDSHIRALRRKLGDGVIRTVHGVGYAFGEAR